mgnify:CR=1 FL=1
MELDWLLAPPLPAAVPRQRLPFPSVLVGSRNDPYCRFDKAQALARAKPGIT